MIQLLLTGLDPRNRVSFQSLIMIQLLLTGLDPRNRVSFQSLIMIQLLLTGLDPRNKVSFQSLIMIQLLLTGLRTGIGVRPKELTTRRHCYSSYSNKSQGYSFQLSPRQRFSHRFRAHDSSSS
eukprot:Blabericola_migrator_1__13254@NODE_923_length_6034_cov_34_268309_g642_i0_p5_GENE_NODE_923_length_6034_cov_34_268309_g642_i0NODE_923_length_6034_cov_34_268309_g642_i0_p5_ORF_typecomplete_len123_score12_63UPF0014/PF03649_13/19UPF0014/PF03649_13/3_2SPT_ssulike/PF11779_8/55SPT_ssulike/PF11779_8/55SPT_ssulike/PF11779_8/48Sperm_Ag_HE2/PF05324_13/47Sperm_Ag_HE2/PF05324_13/42Sperm_Ag_HE2/PF05324_13/31SapB_2/PF03489_17/2e02SapB_2/PF03489_17/1_1e02SapB_2/PF03489_17/1_1e02SapB_2/PF03489_17/4_4e03_NODE_923_